MKWNNPEIKPVDPRFRRQFITFLLIGLVGGSFMVFFAVWSGTKKKMYEMEQERIQAASESQNQP